MKEEIATQFKQQNEIHNQQIQELRQEIQQLKRSSYPPPASSIPDSSPNKQPTGDIGNIVTAIMTAMLPALTSAVVQAKDGLPLDPSRCLIPHSNCMWRTDIQANAA